MSESKRKKPAEQAAEDWWLNNGALGTTPIDSFLAGVVWQAALAGRPEPVAAAKPNVCPGCGKPANRAPLGLGWKFHCQVCDWGFGHPQMQDNAPVACPEPAQPVARITNGYAEIGWRVEWLGGYQPKPGDDLYLAAQPSQQAAQVRADERLTADSSWLPPFPEFPTPEIVCHGRGPHGYSRRQVESLLIAYARKHEATLAANPQQIASGDGNG